MQNVYVHERQWMPTQVYGPEWYGPDHTKVWAGVVLAGQYQVMGRSGMGQTIPGYGPEWYWPDNTKLWAGVVLAGPEWYWPGQSGIGACTLSPLHARTPPHFLPILGEWR